MEGRTLRMQGKVAIVTGAAGGIGRAAARLLAREGARVLVVDVKALESEETVALIERDGGAARFHAADVAEEDQVKAAVEDAASRWGPIRILVNNAGINLVKFLEDTTVEEWDRI